MKPGKLLVGTILAWGLSASLAHAVLSLSFSPLPNSTLQFNGAASGFTFNPGASPQWEITSVSGGAADSIGFQGGFTGGPWSYSPITVSGNWQSASILTPVGTFNISDGHGGIASGTVNWVNIGTFRSLGTINASATINITGMTYTQHNPAFVSSDLATLVAGGAGSVNLSFQFNPGLTVTELTSGSGPFYTTSFSGSMTAVVPEAGTLVTGAVLLLPAAATTFRMLRRRS